MKSVKLVPGSCTLVSQARCGYNDSYSNPRYIWYPVSIGISSRNAKGVYKLRSGRTGDDTSLYVPEQNYVDAQTRREFSNSMVKRMGTGVFKNSHISMLKRSLRSSAPNGPSAFLRDELAGRAALNPTNRATRIEIHMRLNHDIGNNDSVALRFPTAVKEARAVGVEIEFLINNSCDCYCDDEDECDCNNGFCSETREELNNNLPWFAQCGTDSSVGDYGGYEVRVLTSIKNKRSSLKRVCDVLNRYPVEVNKVNAGIHVHLDFRRYEPPEQYRKAARIFLWLNMLRGVIPDCRTEDGYNSNYFGTARDNWLNVGSSRGTCEIRVGAASTNYVKITKWIDLLLAMEATPFPGALFERDEEPSVGELFRRFKSVLSTTDYRYWRSRFHELEGHLMEDASPEKSPEDLLAYQCASDPYKNALRKEINATAVSV